MIRAERRMKEAAPDITDLLREWGGQGPRGLEDVIARLYPQLRALAERQMRRERDGHTLQPTALVGELYLQLAKQHGGEWESRQHFFSFAAMLMRRILIDHAKGALSAKRGGDWERIPLSDDLPWATNSREDILALDAALEKLQQSDARKVRVVELRVLLGCTAAETAEILEISKATADRDWTLARAWLFRELQGANSPIPAV